MILPRLVGKTWIRILFIPKPAGSHKRSKSPYPSRKFLPHDIWADCAWLTRQAEVTLLNSPPPRSPQALVNCLTSTSQSKPAPHPDHRQAESISRARTAAARGRRASAGPTRRGKPAGPPATPASAHAAFVPARLRAHGWALPILGGQCKRHFVLKLRAPENLGSGSLEEETDPDADLRQSSGSERTDGASSSLTAKAKSKRRRHLTFAAAPRALPSGGASRF